MKSASVIIFFCAVFVRADWKEKSRHMEEMTIKARETCAVKLGMTEKEIKEVDKLQEPPETRNQKCIMECLLTEIGVMENGSFSRPGLNKISEFLYDDDPQVLSLTLVVARRCEKELAKMKFSDGCEAAGETTRCLGKVSKQLSLKSGVDDDGED